MFVIALMLSAVYIILIGIIAAITSNTPGSNVITEMIVGYALSCKPVAMMLFKTFGYMTMAPGVTFRQDLKLGHYMKMPPRDMFWA